MTWENRIEIVSREDNANGARGKGGAGSVPVGAELMRLYAQYMHVEYGSLDSDYVFVGFDPGPRRSRVRRPRPALPLMRRPNARFMRSSPLDFVAQNVVTFAVQSQ